MSDKEDETELQVDTELDNNVTVLKSMGIEDEEQIRGILRQTSNNLEEACHLLFPDDAPPPLSSHGSFERISGYEGDMEVQESHINQTDSDKDSTTVSYSLEEDRMKDLDETDPIIPEDLPPSYEDIIDAHQDLPYSGEVETSLMEGDDEEVREGVEEEKMEDPTPTNTPPNNDEETGNIKSIEFPLTHYYELEARVHTDQWSIPYKREESLAICMLSTIRMMKEGPGVAEADENCVKFLERTMTCSFDKLLTHEAVVRWDELIMKGIKEMCLIMIELITVRLKYKPIPIYLLNLLSTAFNADNSFHTRNRGRRTGPTYWLNQLGDDGVFAVCPAFTTRKDPKGWLVDFMNTFAYHGGICHIRDNILYTEDITLQELTALFQPFSSCDEYILPQFFKAEMSPCMHSAIAYIEKLSDDTLKDKEVGCVFDLLKTLKTLFRRCGLIEMTTEVDNLRLTTTLRMFKIPHYNAKMNALKEVVRLTEEPFAAARAGVKNPIPEARVRSWLIINKVLSIAFGGNLHQAQYCDKVKSIVEFLGTELSVDELSTIWDMQVDKNPAQVENIHAILAHAASRFTAQHMDHLFHLIQRSWETASSDRYREKLLGLIGKIGKDDRTGKTASKILELLWGLAHLPQLSREMVELALNSHYSILIDSYHTKDQDRRLYIGKCADDIRKGQWVVSAVRQLHRLAKGMFHSRYGHKDQQQIADLQKQFDLLRLTSATLTKVHARTVQMCREKDENLTGDFIMDGRYSHEECVDVHLQFMSFLLQDGALYLPTKRANEIWDVLVSNTDACATDRRLAFKWFDNSMSDLEYDTQQQLFHKRVLKVDPVLLDLAGYHCIRNFFESINLAERKLRKLQHSHQLIIDNPDLTGIEYLWKAALEVTDKYIADELISSILQISYNSLNQKLKRDSASLHHRFIDECFTRLESLVDPPEDLDYNIQCLCVERLLLLAQRYITVVEESHPYPRQIPPHGACFRGHPIRLHVSADQHQTTFSLDCHSNESLLSVRQRIAQHFRVAPEQVQIGTSEKWLGIHHFNKLIHQMKFTEGQLLIAKTISTGGFGNTFEAIGSTERLQIALKQERLLPGVIMSSEKDVFTKLEQLCRSGESRILAAVRNLLTLIPINQKTIESLEVFVHPVPDEGASEDHRSSFLSPQSVLNEFYDSSRVSPSQLLYNMEVLSGKLMPSIYTTDPSAQVFRRNFLEAGGLKYVIQVLQSSTFPSTMNNDIRQDCYAVALSLAKFLLCAPPAEQSIDELEEGEDVMEEHPISSVTPIARQMSKTKSVEDEVARLTIETMSLDDFRLTLTYLMRVCWSAAAGQLHLASSEEEDSLRRGVCSQVTSVSHKDIVIACESLELFVTCVKLRKNLLSIFYKLPKVKEFIIDVLLGSTHSDLRLTMVDYMYDLCQEISLFSAAIQQSEEPTQAKIPCPPPSEIPHYFFLHLLLDSPMSLWQPTPSTNDLIVWGRCSEYFEFLCRLLRRLLGSEQQLLSIDVPNMLSKELKWLENVSVPEPPCHEVQTLLAGHLNLCTALFSCNGIDKKSHSKTLVPKLLDEFLFPASTLTQETQESLSSGILNISSKCGSIPTRVAAYNLLVELSTDCIDNMKCIAEQLIAKHHTDRPQNPKEWEVRPLVDGRSRCGYVGLKNAGATCYMNSVLQQLYMQPGIKEAVLGIEREEDDVSILPDIQCIFGHLLESRLQYYTPDNFWKTFTLEGRHINVLEHQDASEFFSSLTDQVDETLKKRNYPKVFEERFGGVFLDQIICHGCEHRFEKEQGFTTLQLSVVQSKSLTESLQEFVRGDMLEGDNQYLCGECQEKRDTLKRTCLKTLPSVLVVHLKRFDYDWETNREIKFNNYFEFPWFLDLEPFTAEGISSREKGLGPASSCQYELTGIIVHQGQASAGHYYAFIKNKKGVSSTASTIPTIPEDEEMETQPQINKIDMWLKFNDTIVEEFQFADSVLETECFGGSIKTNSNDPLHNSHPESRVRHWNAYMLFYEAVNPPQRLQTHKVENSSPVPVSPVSSGEDKLSQLQELVQKGERRGMFSDSVPANIQRSVNSENLNFMKNRDVYCKEYFEFIRKLVFCNEVLACMSSHPDSVTYGQLAIQLAIKFLLHTYFRAYKELRISSLFWVSELDKLLQNSHPACEWLIEFLAGPLGENYLKPFLLECTSKEVRYDFCTILGNGLKSYCTFKEIEIDGPLDIIVTSVLKLLDNDVTDNWKTCAEYFQLLKIYANHPKGCRHLLNKDTFVILVQFLLGSTISTPSNDMGSPPRRWSSLQVKEFGGLYGTLSLLVRNTDFSAFETECIEGEILLSNPYMIPSRREDLLQPSDRMHQALFTIEPSNKLIHESTLTLRECDMATTESIAGIFCYCCWNNQSFSACVIGDLQTQIQGVPASELKSYFKVLMEILLIEDSLQDKRIQFTLKGSKYKPELSILRTIQGSTESKRIYQGIKFLVGLANKCRKAREFILTQNDHLQTAVSWLRKKINEYSWSHSSTYSYSNESSSSKIFQRTISAQDTLEEANALLNELEARDTRQTQALTTSTGKNTSSNLSQNQTGNFDDNIEG